MHLPASRPRRTRPRGFIEDWNPSPESWRRIADIHAVLKEYAAYLPMSIRQIYYRLVAKFFYPKDDKAYQRLVELANTARRAGYISFDSIRDDGFTRNEPQAWTSPDACLEDLQAVARSYRRDLQEGQAQRLILWCEAAGMADQLTRVGEPYGVPVFSSGGFDSVTVKHEAALAFAKFGRVEVLHIGDHDPSGVHVFSSLEEDVRAFVAHFNPEARIVFTRLAVTPEQITAYDLPTAPAKKTDKRAFTGQTVQAEALPPDVLARIVEDAIWTRLDHAQFNAVLFQSIQERGRLVAALQDITLDGDAR